MQYSYNIDTLRSHRETRHGQLAIYEMMHGGIDGDINMKANKKAKCTGKEVRELHRLNS